jgi:SpoVK/Ycf46/Vps4 family AAA+-type ATPase
MDSFLSQRDSTEGSAVNSMKSEFLTLWDGLLSEKKNQYESAAPILPQPPIIVLGATNRPYDVDPAILRRLPRSFEIALPNYSSRLQLLNLFLQKQNMTKEARDYVATVAKQTEGYSGSDLKEVCRAAAWEPVRELTSGASQMAVGCLNNNSKQRKSLKRTSSGFPPRGTKARPVNVNDFDLALQKVKKTGDSARQFHKKEFIRGREDRMAMAEEIKKMNGKSPVPPQVDINQLMAAAMAAMNSVQNTSDVRNGEQNGEDSDDEPPEMFVDASNGVNRN